MSFDYSGMLELRDNMIAMDRRSEEFIRKFLLEMGLRWLARTKGRQQGKYGDSFKAVDTGTMLNSWTLSEIYRKGDMLIIEMINPVEYASHVEYGHRTVNGGFVEGKFMCRFSLEEIEKELPARWEKAFKVFISSLGF